MLRINFFYIFMFGLITPLVMSKHVQFYRKDYKYIEKFDAFYKMHWDINGLSWNSAFLTCHEEGAQLFYPKANYEWTIVSNLTGSLDVVPNVTDIFVGIHDEYEIGSFITVDGQSTPSPLFNVDNHLVSPKTKSCVLMDMETGIFKIDSCLRPTDEPAPYICKKMDDESCPTIDRGYKYMKENNKCYKVNERKKTWQDAMQTCFMEGGILTVIDNVAEATVIKSLSNINNNNNNYFIGFRKMAPYEEYYTVTGEEIMGHYIKWYNNPQEQCGGVFVSDDLYTTTANCNDQLPFICEMEVKP